MDEISEDNKDYVVSKEPVDLGEFILGLVKENHPHVSASYADGVYKIKYDLMKVIVRKDGENLAIDGIEDEYLGALFSRLEGWHGVDTILTKGLKVFREPEKQ